MRRESVVHVRNVLRLLRLVRGERRKDLSPIFDAFLRGLDTSDLYLNCLCLFAVLGRERKTPCRGAVRQGHVVHIATGTNFRLQRPSLTICQGLLLNNANGNNNNLRIGI